MGELNSEAVKLEIFRLDLIKGNTRDLNICFYSPTHPREIDECKMMQVGRKLENLKHEAFLASEEYRIHISIFRSVGLK